MPDKNKSPLKGLLIEGFGGGGSSSSRTPVEAKDNLFSKESARILDLISEGEIKGLVNGHKSIFLDDTPLQNPNGSYNFENVVVSTRAGTQNQTPIPNFPDTENELAINVEVKFGQPVTRQFSNENLTSLIVRVSTPRLFQQDASSGDTNGYYLPFNIELQTDNGIFRVVHRDSFNGKTTAKYSRSIEINLPRGAHSWAIRVNKLIQDATTNRIQSQLFVDAITEVVDANLSYPNSALIGINVLAEQFPQIPRRGYEVYGIKVKIPSNYNPYNRTYSGSWDGSFKVDWTDNPAWIFYALATHPLYGLGQRIKEQDLDKWGLYQIAQHCDQMVPNGRGGQEPRFTINTYLQNKEQAYELLQNIASVFRGMAYYAAGAVFATSDRPALEKPFIFSPSNVVDGKFNYEGSPKSNRYSVAVVGWNDPTDMYRQKYEYVEDRVALNRYGYAPTEFNAFGCTSQGQAHRAGKWALLTSNLETQVVTFKVSLEAMKVIPGSICAIQDPSKSNMKGVSGRISSATTTTVTVDRDLNSEIRAGHKIFVTMPSGVTEERTISNVSDRKLTVSQPFSTTPQAESQWAIETGIKLQLFRVLSVTDSGDSQFEIRATEHDPRKYDSIESNVVLEDRPTVNWGKHGAAPSEPTNLDIRAVTQGVEGSASVLVGEISWSSDVARHTVRYRRGSEGWVTHDVVGTSLEIPNFKLGTYQVEVTAINIQGMKSGTTTLTKSVTGVEFTLRTPPNLRLEGDYTSSWLKVVWGSVPGATGYTVRISALGVVRRTVPVGNSLRFDYSAADMRDDLGPWRDVTVEVMATGPFDAKSDWANLSVSNPQIGPLQGIQVEPNTRSILMTANKPTEEDLAGYLYWISDDPNFTPTASNATHDVNFNQIFFELFKGEPLENKDYYVWAAGYDTFGKDSLNISSSYKVKPLVLKLDPQSISEEMIADGAFTITKFADNIKPPVVVDEFPENPKEYDRVVLTSDGKTYQYINGEWSSRISVGDLEGRIEAPQLSPELNDAIDLIFSTDSYVKDEVVPSIINVDNLISNAQTDISNAQSDIGNIFGSIGTLDDLIDDLSIGIGEQDARIDALQAELSDLIGSPDWDASESYLVGQIVKLDAGLYRAKQNVPAGTPVSDTNFWEKIGNYESIGEAVASLLARMSTSEAYIDDITGEIVAHSQELLAMQSDLTDLDSEVSGQAAAINNLETNVTEIDGKITAQAQETSIIKAELRDSDSTGYLDDVLNSWDNRAQITETRKAIIEEGKAQAVINEQLGVQIGDNTALIDNLREVVVTETEARARQVSQLQSELSDLESDVNGQATAIDNLETSVEDIEGKVTSHSSSISGLQNRISDTESGLSGASDAIDLLESEVESVNGKIIAQTNSTNILQAQLYEGADDNGYLDSVLNGWLNRSQIVETRKVLSEESKSRAESVFLLNAAIAENTASILETNTVLVDETKALSHKLTQQESEFDSNKSSVENQITTLTDAQSSQAHSTNVLRAQLYEGVDDDGYLDSVLNSWNNRSQIVDTRKVISEESKSRAEDVTSLSSTVGNHTTKITSHSSSIDGLEGQVFQKINNNGYITGWGLSSTTKNGTPTSAFKILSNALVLGDPKTPDVNPFRVETNGSNSRLVLDGNIIATGSITANALGANSITAGKIAAGAVGADQISAGAITASKLTISNMSNLFLDQEFNETYANWTKVGTGIEKNGTGSQHGTYHDHTSIKVKPGDIYLFSAKVTRVGGAAWGGTGGVTLHLQRLTSSGWSYLTAGLRVSSSESGTTITGSPVTIPAGTTAIRLGFFTEANVPSSNRVRIEDVFVRQMMAGELIVDGSIKTQHMTANSIQGDRIAANTLNGDKVIANTLHGNKIQANTITADRLAANTITAASGKIADAAITTAKIANANITTAKIADGNITTAKIADANITAAKIANANITSAKIGDLQVSRIKIANNAVTTMSQYSRNLSSGGELSLNIPSGSIVFLSIRFLTNGGHTVHIYRGGSRVWQTSSNPDNVVEGPPDKTFQFSSGNTFRAVSTTSNTNIAVTVLTLHK